MKNRKTLFAAVLAVLLALLVYIIWGNTALEINEYTVSSGEIPGSFNGFRIAQISDLHNAEIGKDNARLLRLLEKADADIIVITGDLVDSRRTDINCALAFAEAAARLAPIYYVSGNHEARIDEYEKLITGLETAGVTVLDNECLSLELSGEKISLMGINDPSFMTDYLFGDSESAARSILEEIRPEEGYSILLSHRPELFELYAELEIDLVFSGHAHGDSSAFPLSAAFLHRDRAFFPNMIPAFI